MRALDSGWQLAETTPNLCAAPGELATARLQWRDAMVPGTVASVHQRDYDHRGRYDASDWWYRTRFSVAHAAGVRHVLRMDGLATLAQVWLNGEPILGSRNMFLAHRVDVTRLLRDSNELVMVFRSLDVALHQRRPRPRWKTPLVKDQNLRWFRTTLLGRIPGWTPPIEPVGPWGPVSLETIEAVGLRTLDLRARAQGRRAQLTVGAELTLASGAAVSAARVRLDDALYPLQVDGLTVRGDVIAGDVPLWWPHTHGVPHLVDCAVEVQVNGAWIELESRPVGFKEIAFVEEDGRMQPVVNGAPIFCRGACWTTLDAISLRGEGRMLRQALEQARDAGINMLRVGGTMVYESEAFYRLCDELGILVWQDFMFANMDYPVADPAFRDDIETEARQQLGRLQRHVCVAVYCGGSEIAQQAAMLGRPESDWSNDFFRQSLAALCDALHPGVPYFPSTPWGGALPFHVATGISHYYGVGAYRRPLSDLKTARVKFTPECLGFSNVPEPPTCALVVEGSENPPPHHPRWKARQPRDSGAGWDFEDVRDHYLELLFGVDALELRATDLARYYALSRRVPGEVMSRAFAEWRKPGSQCGGALVWFYRDLWPGAGWGIVDSTSAPKATYWYVKRAWKPQAIFLTDEGLDGLNVHVVNEAVAALDAHVEIDMLHGGRLATTTAKADVVVEGRGAVTLSVDALVGYFTDSTRAYRFGPAKHDVITARLRRRADGALLSEDAYFPGGWALPAQAGARLSVEAAWQDDGTVSVALQSDCFLQSVAIACAGFEPTDNYFHLAPKHERRIVCRPRDVTSATFKAEVEALNLPEPVSVRADRSSGERGMRAVT